MATDLPTNIIRRGSFATDMSGAVQNAQHEFWRAPLASPEPQVAASPELVEACERCNSEFIMGAAFCHVCGSLRHAQEASVTTRRWSRYLEFHNIKEALGLPLPSLIAFLFGTLCAVAAVGVGFVFSATTVLDWQAVQVWRIQWLLGSVAAFVAGLLLKHATSKQ